MNAQARAVAMLIIAKSACFLAARAPRNNGHPRKSSIIMGIAEEGPQRESFGNPV